jgi:hypothetical protein
MTHGALSSFRWLGVAADSFLQRSSIAFQELPRVSKIPANLLYSPTIGSLEHDRIAIERHVERENPNGRRSPIDRETEDCNRECQYKRYTVADLGTFRCELGAIQEFIAVLWFQERIETVQERPYAGRNHPFDGSDSEPAVDHRFYWVNGLEKTGQV